MASTWHMASVSTLWCHVLESELGSSGLVADALTHLVISTAPWLFGFSFCFKDDAVRKSNLVLTSSILMVVRTAFGYFSPSSHVFTPPLRFFYACYMTWSHCMPKKMHTLKKCLFLCFCAHDACVLAHVMEGVQWSEDNFVESLLFDFTWALEIKLTLPRASFTHWAVSLIQLFL